MICQRCLFRLQRPTTRLARTYAASAKTTRAPPPPNPARARGPATETHEGAPAATSSTAAQPFSARETDPPTDHGTSPKMPTMEPSGSVAEIERVPRAPSSCPAGTPLGLGYFKDKEQPVALEDHEYPAWLWTLLDKTAEGGSGQEAISDGDIYSKSKAQRKKAAKAALQAAKKGGFKNLKPEVPIERQTIDLPAGDGTVKGAIEAQEVRDDLRVAMRSKRRKDIKESNYLKSMG